jgi:alkanesulfonate monooxygenase SsuD/methylene tetrahydromethanopterin reductase-like flavin-dependent oxidoreductase (luciferase family)
MLVLEPYPGFEGKHFSMPCRNVVPKPMQRPHPPMWMACTNRDTIRVAARNGIGALAFSFVDPEEAHNWAEIYYGIIKSDECVPIGHSVNAKIAMVSNFSLHEDRETAIRRGLQGFEFFGYALNALVAHDTVPGRTDLWGEYLEKTGGRVDHIVEQAARGEYKATGIGTPEDMKAHLTAFQEAGVDQIIFMQQAGRNKHDDICDSLRLFAQEVMPDFKVQVAAREAAKAQELAPHIDAALARKVFMQPLADGEVPVVKASVAKAQVGSGDGR